MNERNGEFTLNFTLNWRFYNNDYGWVGLCDQIPMLVDAGTLPEAEARAKELTQFATDALRSRYKVEEIVQYLFERSLPFEMNAVFGGDSLPRGRGARSSENREMQQMELVVAA